MQRQQKQLGDLLLEKGLISEVQLYHALKEQRATKEFLGQVLVKRGYIREQDLLDVLSKQYHMPTEHIGERYLDFELINKFGSSLIIDHHCVALTADDTSATFAITNPLDAWTLKKAEEAARGYEVKFVLATRQDVEEAMKRYQRYVQGKIRRYLR